MHTFFCSKCFLVIAVCVVFIALAAPCAQASGIEIIPWVGKIVDKETGEPIEGAVIVRSWNRYAIGPEGSQSTGDELQEEELSNKKGRFVFRKKKLQISVPVFWDVLEEKTIIYKPGYKALFLDDKPLIIYLQRVPTLVATREHAKPGYSGVFDTLPIFNEMLNNEEDFIGRNLTYNAVLISKGRMDDPTISRSTVGGRFYTRYDFSGDLGFGRGSYTLDSLGLTNAASQGPEAFLAALKKKDCGTQAAACYALKNKKDPQSLQLLVAVLKKSSCEEAKRRAADELIKNAQALGAEDIMGLTQEKDCRVRAAVCVALGKKNDSRTVQIFIDILKNDPCGDVKKNAAEGLVKLGAVADKALEKALADSDEALKKELAWVVGQRPREKDTTNPLAGMDYPLEESLPAELRSSPPEVRIQRLQRLGNWKNDLTAKPILEVLITETDSNVKRAAADALFAIGDPSIVALADAAGSGSNQRSAECMQILDEFLDRIEIARVIAMLSSRWHGEDLFIERFRNGIPHDRDARVVKHFRAILLDRYAGPKDLAALRLSQLGGEGFNVLEEAMNSDYSENRKCAARAMGELKDRRFIEPLIAALKDNHPDVQLTVAWALGELNDPRAIEPLVGALNSDANVRKKIREVLIKMPIDDTAPLRAFLKGSTQTGKQEAVWVLGEIQDKKAVEQIAGLLATSSDPDVRGEAVFSLGKIKDPQGLPALLQALRSKDKQGLASMIGHAIAMINSNTEDPVSDAQKQQLLSVFISIVKNSSSLVEKQAAVDVLGELRDTRATDTLLYVLKNESRTASARTRESIEVDIMLSETVKALEKIKDPASVEPLIAMLNTPDTAPYAAAVLGGMQDPRAVEPLLGLLDNPQPGSSVIYALERFRDVRAVEPLVKILDTENHKNRYAAASALGSFNDPRAIEALARAGKSEDVGLKQRALRSLAKVDLDYAVEALPTAKRPSVDYSIRKNALGNIASRQDPAYLDVLIDVLENDKHAPFREKAAQALGQLKDERAIKPIDSVLQVEENEPVRKACISALEKIEGRELQNHYASAKEVATEKIKNVVSRKSQKNVESRLAHELGDPPAEMLSIGNMAVEDIIPLLKNKSVYKRRAAALALGTKGNADAVDGLVGCLQDKEAEVRWSAAWALGQIGDSRAIDALTLMSNDPDIGLRRRAHTSLKEIQMAGR